MSDAGPEPGDVGPELGDVGPELDDAGPVSSDVVAAFVAGTLDARGEDVLADQVARLVAQPGPLPDASASALTRIVHTLGGEDALLTWLDRHPGRPRLTARLIALTDLLDRYSFQPAVVAALRELRAHRRYPPGLEEYLPVDTDATTLADLGGKIELLLADDDLAEAGRVAPATVAMLTELAPRVTARDPGLAELGTAVEHLRQEIQDASRSR
jgi:hypothetical protein